MKIIVIIIILLIISSCSLSQSCTLEIQNESKYQINVSCDKGENNKLTLEKDDGDFLLVTPGEVKIKINIDEIKYSNEYTINLNYLEKRKFNFNINE